VSSSEELDLATSGLEAGVSLGLHSGAWSLEDQGDSSSPVLK
jgi:hypothetical protein